MNVNYTDLRISMLSLYKSMTEDTRKYGRLWYDDARQSIRNVATTTGCAFPLHKQCAIVAVLSPQSSWKMNLEDASLAFQYLPVKYGKFNQYKVTALYQDDLSVIRGNKVKAFYQNLTGNMQAVTLDAWMLKLIPDITYRFTPTDKLYRDYSEIVLECADLCGELPAHLQAMCWIQLHIQNKKPWF